jgi:hypothetical protein
VTDHTLSVNNESRSFGEAQKIEHAVLAGNFLSRITQQGKSEPELFCKPAISFRLIDANPQNLSAGAFKIGKTILVCREFLRSTRRVCVDIKSQDDPALPQIVTKPNRTAHVVGQLKIRRLVSNLQSHSCHSYLKDPWPGISGSKTLPCSSRTPVRND